MKMARRKVYRGEEDVNRSDPIKRNLGYFSSGIALDQWKICVSGTGVIPEKAGLS